MEILQKNTYFIFHMATVTRPQQPSTLGSSQVQLLLVGDRCKMVAIKHHPENTRPARDLEMPNVGGFGPNRLVSTPSDNEPVHLLPSAAFDFAFHVTRSKVHSTTWQKIRPAIRIHPLWTSAVLTLPCKNTRHGNWSEVLCSEENNSSYAAVQTQFEYKKNPIGLSMIKDYILWLQPGPTRSEESSGKWLSKMSLRQIHTEWVTWAKTEEAFLTLIQTIWTLEWCSEVYIWRLDISFS